MIAIKTLFESFCDYAKDYPAGANPTVEWCKKLNEAQYDIMDKVAPLYDDNERIKKLMRDFITPYTANTTSNGEITTVPDTLYRIIQANVLPVGADPILVHYSHENSVAMTYGIPQRSPSLANKIIYYHFTQGGMQLYPKQVLPFSMLYLRKPEDGYIEYVETAIGTGEFALRPVNGTMVDLLWDESGYNLILYSLLEKYGIIKKEVLLTEYGKFGIQTDLINVPK